MTHNILSIDGGGVRGIIPLYYLWFLEQDLIKFKGKTIYETFDSFAGTSIGSIIVGSLIYTEYKTIDDIIINLFTTENIKSIFSESYSILSPTQYRPKYSDANKTKLINETVGKKMMSESCDKNVLFTLYSVDEQEPKFFKSYENLSNENNVKNNEKNNVLVSDIVRASSSAPSYFPSSKYTVNGQEHYGIDGAVFANNPTDYIYADALKIYGPETKMNILSLGTGDHILNHLGPETTSWGSIQWVTEGDIFDIILSCDQSVVDYKMKHFANALGHKYIRVHKPVRVALDDYTKIEELKNEAFKWYLETKDSVLQMLN